MNIITYPWLENATSMERGPWMFLRNDKQNHVPFFSYAYGVQQSSLLLLLLLLLLVVVVVFMIDILLCA